MTVGNMLGNHHHHHHHHKIKNKPWKRTPALVHLHHIFVATVHNDNVHNVSEHNGDYVHNISDVFDDDDVHNVFGDDNGT